MVGSAMNLSSLGARRGGDKQRARDRETGSGAESEECRGGGSGGLVLSAAAAPEQWLGKFMRLCVIIIKQVSRGTAGKENGVRRARGGEPGRGVESDGGLKLSVGWEAYVIVRHHHQPGVERDGGRGEWRWKCTRRRARARGGKYLRSAEVGRGQRKNNGWESLRACVCHHVIIINQVSRGTVGKDNSVGRTRGGAPGRGAESEE